MQQITEKIHKNALAEFYSVAEKLALEGRTEEEIVSVFQNVIKIRQEQYYENEHSPKLIGEILRSVFPNEADSKAEAILYGMFIDSGLKFEFQHKIGPYKVDYLFSGSLVVELDGPQHTKEHDDKKDKYLRKMGYKIIRIPLWILTLSPLAIIEEIHQAIESINSKKRKKIK